MRGEQGAWQDAVAEEIIFAWLVVNDLRWRLAHSGQSMKSWGDFYLYRLVVLISVRVLPSHSIFQDVKLPTYSFGR
jgi:hypothetical protein